MTDALRCTGISKTFDDVFAVDSVDLHIQAGQFLTMLGPSGCGKTSTLRLIAGFERPDSGDIYINEQLVADKTTFLPPEKRRVGMVFQDYALFPHLNVADNIGFGLSGSPRDKSQRVKEMLALVGLDGIGKRMPYELSGGQQQRVALARALAPQPELILLDEPFSNLDTALRAQVRTEVRTILRQAGMSAIFVTHDQEEALSLSDLVAVMFDGHIAQIDSPQHLYRNPVSREVGAFVGEANFLPAEAHGMAAVCVLGDVPLQSAHDGAVELLIRPENLLLTGEYASPENTVNARILWREFYGHDQRVGLELAEDGTRLVARASASLSYQRDDTVQVGVIDSVLAFDS